MPVIAHLCWWRSRGGEPHTGRVTGRGVGASGVIVLLLAGCGAHRPAANDGANTTDPMRATALKAARQLQATVHGQFLVATYRPNFGLRSSTNTGHPCVGRTLQVRLLWNGANFTHGASTGERGDDRHQALVATVIASSGVPCLVGADYGSGSDPRPGEIYLYGPRKDLVPAQ
jgi:hypothetical protein